MPFLIRALSFSFFFLADPLFAQEETNVIRIQGKRQERERKFAEGAVSVFTPSDASQFSSSEQIKSESSLQLTRTSRISPSGFVLPRFRGHEARFSEIYLEDQLLQDPYTSLPFWQDLDLRALGQLVIYQGVSPPEMGTANPLGSAVYRFSRLNRSQTTLGLQAGKPLGISGFGIGQYVSSPFRSRLFLRGHTTDGKYNYYDDNGTPYNDSDDRSLWRENNQQQSWQGMPYLQYDDGKNKLTYYGLFYKSNRGIPQVRKLQSNNDAREKVEGQIHDVQWQHLFEPALIVLPDKISAEVQLHKENRVTEDESQTVLVTTDRSAMDFQTTNVLSFLEWQKDWLYLKTQAQHSFSQIDLEEGDTNDHLTRKVNSYYAGTRVELPMEFSMSGKYQQKVFAKAETNARSLVLAWEYLILNLYTQWATYERRASLLEELGNGSGVQANRDLLPEKTTHKEVGLGVRILPNQLTFSSAYFQDLTQEKIVFVPSLANSIKAANIETSRIHGFESQLEAKPFSTSRIVVSTTRLWPTDLSSAGNHKQIPGVANRYHAFSVEQEVNNFTLRWFTHYRGKVYRDLRNHLELPGVWISDAGIDYSRKLSQRVEWSCGLSVNNVFDVKKVAISSADGSENGHTSYSEVSGHPLPGRSFQTIATVSF